MNTNNTILNQTNPAYNTAKLTLSNLSRAGVPEAVKYAEILGFTDFRKEYAVNEQNKSEMPQAILQNTRYEFINRCIRESGCKNVIDVACGFSPRGYMLAQEGYRYLGLDLEVSVEALSAIAAQLTTRDMKGSFRYQACDITDPDRFAAMADAFEGEVLIVCEGLMMYLQEFETRSFCAGLERILRKHGGRFVTPDYITTDLYMAAHIAYLGQEEGMKALYAMAAATTQKIDNAWASSLQSRGGSPKAVALFSELRFNIGKTPYYVPAEHCPILDRLEPDAGARFRAALSRFDAWSVTIDAQTAADHETRVLPYDVTTSLANSVLTLTMQGRVDSLTATELMKTYEQAANQGSYEAIVLDMTRLQYISSAGLRVLLIMKKACDRLSLTGVCPEIREILDTTGFSDILGLDE